MVSSSHNRRLAMNGLNVLTEEELDAVSGGDKPTVPVAKGEPISKGADSTLLSAVESAGSLIGAGGRFF
jgi:bacteriocin-like protein